MSDHDFDHLEQRCIDNLKSPNPRQRSQAVQELGRLKATCAVPHLITLLREDVNTYVRSACAEALGHIGDSAAIFPLMDALRDPCSFVRRAAAIALGQMQAREAQGALLNALNDGNFYVRRAAINAIGKLEIPDMGAVLLPLLATPDMRIRRTVLIALRRLRAREAVPPMIAMLRAYLESPNQRDLPVVKTLVVALGDLQAREAIPILADVVRGYVGARSLAASAIGQIGGTEGGPVLLESLADKSVNLQLAALKSLGRIGYREALPAVREFLTSPDPRLRRVAALAVGNLRDTTAIPTLLKMVYDDPSPLVRPAALEALGLLGDRQLIPHLLPLVNDSNAYLRAALAHTLGSLDGNTPAVQEALKKLAQDQVGHVAYAAERALLNCGKKVEEQAPSETKACPEPPKKHFSWLKRFLVHPKSA
ncbi:MAG TPA: HEAT repeat domain-containing protein [Anaerolineae bacterium]|nr:HEAT repeat domain-containing protein [Anaerolineae bacterium]HQK13573.1 HEAT repeat domain-containing protein [Anaerolineae bacterium]